MDIVVTLLFWLHLVALAMAGAAVFGMPVVGRHMAGASAETRPTLMTIAKGLSTIARAALAILIITGPLLVWLKYGGMAGFSVWFTVKMVLVVLLLASVIYSGILMKRAQGGDRSAASMLPRLGMANMVLVLAIVLCAVLAFG
jgi:putative membrane protein